MEYVHKVSAIRLINKSKKSSIIKGYTFTSNLDLYKLACLAIVNHNKELHNRYLFEPITKSPIIFDLTVEKEGTNDATEIVEKEFLTFSELMVFCDSIENDDTIKKIITQPFCHVHFSQAGRAGAFFNKYIDTFF